MPKTRKPTLRESVVAMLAELKSGRVSPKPKETQSSETENVYGVLQMAGQEQQPDLATEPLAAISQTDGLVIKTPGTCPKCGNALSPSMPGVGQRCQSCAWQEGDFQPKGFSRADYFNGTLSGRKTKISREQQLHPPGFARALGRLVFGGR